jgi:PGF-CTERM protein
LATPATYGTGTPGSVRIEAFIDGRWNAVDEGVTDISAFDDDGSTVILMAEPTLAVEVSVVSVAQDDDFYVRGTAPGTDNVDILTLAPKGGGGKGMSAAGTVIPLVPGYVTRAGTVPGLYGATSGVSEVDYTYEKKIDVDDDADTGTYLVGVLSPGRDGIYNGVGEPSATLIAGIVRDYCGGNAGLLASKTTEQFISILQDATKGAAGSDDLVEVTFIKVESPFVEIGPIADVPIGTDLVVTGTSNRKEGFSIVVTVKAPGTELSPATALIENGTFSATFDTSTATEGRYTVKADDGDGHTDEATVTLVTGVPTPPTEVTPTPEEVTPTPPTEVTPPAEVTPTPEESPEVPPEETPKPPGFEAVFAIAGLLAVAYLVLRRKK